MTDHEQTGAALMDGERIERVIRASAPRARTSARREETLLLTNSRIVHVMDAGRRIETVMASVDDVESVEIGAVSEGYGAFVWAGLAALLSIALYAMIENEPIRIVAPLLALAMGVYLVVNRLFFSGGTVAVFRMGATSITWSFETEDEAREVQEFIRELYRLKTARRRGYRGRWGRWRSESVG